MRITTMLSNQHIGRKGCYQWSKQRFHRFGIRIVFSEWFQRNIHRVTATAPISQFEHITRTRKKVTPCLVERDSHYAGIIVKGPLDAIAMMSIKIDIEYFGLAGLEHMSNSDSSIIIYTETRGTLCPGMM